MQTRNPRAGSARRTALERRCACIAASILLCACASAPSSVALEGEPELPRIGQQLLPSDSDLVLRLDVRRLSDRLGAELTQRLLLDALLAPDDSAGRALLAPALTATDLLWLGMDEHSNGTERVLVLRGNFQGWERWPGLQANWVFAAGGLARELRDRSSPAARFRRVAKLDGGLWLASAGAKNAESQRARQRLLAPERGLISAALSLSSAREQHLGDYPQLARHLDHTRWLTGHLEPKTAGIELAVDVEFDTPTAALVGRDVLALLVERLRAETCVVGGLARAARLSVFEASLRVRAALDPPVVQAVEACVLGGDCCG